jgi:hypothetical protein
LPRKDERFEVILLGCAHGPGGAEVLRRTVAMSLGNVRRELRVTGDRVWQVGADGLVMSDPHPFTRMPLTWDRAFGGTARVELGPGVTILVPDPINPAGRGFDPLRALGPGANALGLPEGYPRLLEPRLLPNVEAPETPVRRPEDTPAPACWATLPAGSLLRVDTPRDPARDSAPMGRFPTPVEMDRACFNASQDWLLEAIPVGTPLVLEGMSEAPSIALALPTLRVVADYVVGQRQGVVPLEPITLVVLPEERRATITYRGLFRVTYEPALERSLRLRLEESRQEEPWRPQ